MDAAAPAAPVPRPQPFQLIDWVAVRQSIPEEILNQQTEQIRRTGFRPG